MSRVKTYLSPEQQCKKTLELAIEWINGMELFIRMLAESNPPSSWFEREKHARELLIGISNPRFKKSYLELYEWIRGDEIWNFGDTWKLGVAKYNTRHLLRGDIVLVMLTNGWERHPVWAVSSKGKVLAGYYLETNRLGGDLGIINFLGCPDELIGKQLTDPARQVIMMGLRAGVVAPQSGRRV